MFIRTIALTGLLAVAACGLADGPLVVGSKAPAIDVLKWVKGSPVKLGGGKVNVVEFWATWCGPCKQTIPHLTELAKKYKGKVTFTGVSVWEVQPGQDFTTVPEKVAKFVKDMGPKMDYTVAMDGPKRSMATSWMEAAKQDGIPTAFVVDGTGAVVWIGHPMDNLDGVLDKVLAGKWNVSEQAKKSQEKVLVAEDMKKAGEAIQAAAQTNDPKKILAAVEDAITKYPRTETALGVAKFNILLATGASADAVKYANSRLYDLYKDDAEALNTIAWAMVEKPAPGFDYAVAVKFAERANSVGEGKNAMVLDTLGLAYFRSGAKAKAIAIQEKAVALAKTTAGFDPATLKEITDRLTEFKTAK